MISFLVIGKNEGWRLSKCIASIYDVIKYDNIQEYEIIYVDSASTDDSLEQFSKHPEVHVFSITGECNAAIARNIAASEAHGDILFFIDGDMEIQQGFLSMVLHNRKLIYPFISGVYIDYVYDDVWQFKEIIKRFDLTVNEERKEPVTGGLFLIDRELYNSIHGMDPRLKRSQDLDFGLRLSKKSISLIRKGFVLAIHHTLSYTTGSRLWNSVWNTRYTSVLTRKHLLTLPYYGLLFRSQYSAMVLFLSLLLMPIWESSLLFYLSVLLLRAFKTSVKQNLQVLKSIQYILCRDLVFILCLLFYYPVRPPISFKRIA